MMNLKKHLKENAALRHMVKKIKIYHEYLADASDFSKYYLEKSEMDGHYEYRMMLLIHSLEKGICMPDSRPLGQKKCLQLLNLIKKCDEVKKNRSEYSMGLGILQSWLEFYEDHKWTDDSTYMTVKKYMEGIDKATINIKPGYKILSKNELLAKEQAPFKEFIMSRHSVRDFSAEPLSEEDIRECLGMAVTAPTACNRQMCKIYQVKRREYTDLLNKTVLGVSGFNHNTVNYFIVTYDISAFDFFGERNQGYLNSGLVAMDFVNALHFKGIGSCFLQWANKRSEGLLVKKTLGIPENEKIAIVIGAGYYPESCKIPCSCRKKLEEVFIEII
jgi:nitroreductase